MKRAQIDPREVQECLSANHLSGVPLGSLSMAECYATIASSPPTHFLGDPNVRDWAVVSYVHTESAVASGGMPEWACADVDNVLDALLHTRRLNKRAVWFDRLAMHVLPERWPSIATLHVLSSPVIAVLPTRTIEYSRYQIPDRWDPETSDFYTRLELLFRQCPRCSTKVPLEYDSRLLNIAAALRAWPFNEVMMARASRGAFISFTTLDRIRYTLSWYVLLLQAAMRITRCSASSYNRVTQMYGPPLFETCYDCISYGCDIFFDENVQRHIDTLDETLGILLGHASRLCLPFTRSPAEGYEIWSLPGWVKSPGDIDQMPPDNASRLDAVSGQFLVQARFEQIAANMIRGPGAQAPCFRHGDKWMCALILSNISDFLYAFRRGTTSLDVEIRSACFELMVSINPFGDFFFEDHCLDASVLSDGVRVSCVRSPPCRGTSKSACLLNELSGILTPESVGQFFQSCGFPEAKLTKLINMTTEMLFQRVEKDGAVFYGYEYSGLGLSDNDVCVRCRYRGDRLQHMYTTMIVLAWRARAPASNAIDEFESVPHSSIFSYIAIDVDDIGHVVSRGVLNLNFFSTCSICMRSYTQGVVSMPCLTKTGNVIEIHVDKHVSPFLAMGTISTVLHESHGRRGNIRY